MSRYHRTSTSRALYRVFVAPNLVPRPQLSIQHAPAFQRIPLLPITPVRTRISAPRKRNTDRKRQTIFDVFTFDNNITSTYINLIDASGTFIPNIHFDEALRKRNRTREHILMIREGQTNELGAQVELPLCKIVTKIELRLQYNKKVEGERKADKTPPLKNLELNWAIAQGDLKHRLEKMKSFLKEGKRVEVTFGPRKRGRQATEAEARELLKAVGDAVNDCKGAKEDKREGSVGGVMTILLHGKKLTEEEPKKAEPKKEEPEEEEHKEEAEVAKV